MHTIKFQFVEEFEKQKFVDQQRGVLWIKKCLIELQKKHF